MHSYFLEFILSVPDTPVNVIKNALTEFSQDIVIEAVPKKSCEPGEDLKIKIRAEEPTIIFDTCAQFGRIKSVKVNEKGD